MNSTFEASVDATAMNAWDRTRKRNRGVLLFLFALLPASARAEVTFQGYLATREHPLFVLSSEKKETSGWLTVGQIFAGYSIVSFDAPKELLTVEKDGRRQVLHLVGSKVQATETAPEPIVLMLGDSERVIIGADDAVLGPLREKLKQLAAANPQPSVLLKIPPKTEMGRVRVLMDLIKESGLKRFSLQSM